MIESDIGLMVKCMFKSTGLTEPQVWIMIESLTWIDSLSEPLTKIHIESPSIRLIGFSFMMFYYYVNQ